jgi:pantetheine-phosphate adenylyltransferase
MSASPEPDSHFPTSPETVDRALLVASLPNLSIPHFLAPVISSAATATRHRLVIILFSRFFNASPNSTPKNVGFASGVSHSEHWNDVQRLLTFVYVQATKVGQDMGKVLMVVDVLLKGMDEDVQEELGIGMDIVFRVTGSMSYAVSTQSFLLPQPRSRNFDQPTT